MSSVIQSVQKAVGSTVSDAGGIPSADDENSINCNFSGLRKLQTAKQSSE